MSDTSNPPSIRDIAEIAGVSVATVSRVLNKKGKYSATTEKRVLAVVNSCGYISNMSAKSLREARSHTVGLIVPNVTNAFFSQLAYSIETELFQRNYSVFICNSGTDADKERDYFRTLIGKCVDGILCISDLNEIPSDILDRGVPILHGEGGYTHESSAVLLSIVSNRELPRLEKLAHSIDPTCFLIVSHVTEVSGRGFSMDKDYL